MAPSHGTKKSLILNCWILSGSLNLELLLLWKNCTTSHFCGRTFASVGYCVRLIPAQHVKAFIRSQKNDANHALAICETAFRPDIHFVSVKNTEQQDIKALRNTCPQMVEQRTALTNQLRSLLTEYGFTIPFGVSSNSYRS